MRAGLLATVVALGIVVGCQKAQEETTGKLPSPPIMRESDTQAIQRLQQRIDRLEIDEAISKAHIMYAHSHDDLQRNLVLQALKLKRLDNQLAVKWMDEMRKTQGGRFDSHIAWISATSPDSHWRDPKLALESALKGVATGKTNDYVAAETLAAAYACNDKFDEAVEAQQTAISLWNATRADMRGGGFSYDKILAYRLDGYKKHKACIDQDLIALQWWYPLDKVDTIASNQVPENIGTNAPNSQH